MRRHDDQESGIRLVRAGARFEYRPDALAQHRIEGRLSAGLREIAAQGEHDVKLGLRHPHLRARLGVVAMSRPGTAPLSPRSTAAFRRPRSARVLLHTGPAAARVAGALRMRRAERRVCRDLSAVAYATGLRRSFATLEELREFVAPAWDEAPVARAVVDLAGRTPIEVPPAGGRLIVELVLEGRALAALDAWEGAREWNWDELAERAAEAALEPARAMGVGRLLKLA
jgi:hypothetical protein